MDTKFRNELKAKEENAAPNAAEKTNGEAAATRTLLRAEGFSCPSCVSKVERQLARMKGVSGVTVHFASARIEVMHDPAAAPVDELVKAVAKAGYRAKPAAF